MDNKKSYSKILEASNYGHIDNMSDFVKTYSSYNQSLYRPELRSASALRDGILRHPALVPEVVNHLIHVLYPFGGTGDADHR